MAWLFLNLQLTPICTFMGARALYAKINPRQVLCTYIIIAWWNTNRYIMTVWWPARRKLRGKIYVKRIQLYMCFSRQYPISCVINRSRKRIHDGKTRAHSFAYLGIRDEHIERFNWPRVRFSDERERERARFIALVQRWPSDVNLLICWRSA